MFAGNRAPSNFDRFASLRFYTARPLLGSASLFQREMSILVGGHGRFSCMPSKSVCSWGCLCIQQRAQPVGLAASAAMESRSGMLQVAPVDPLPGNVYMPLAWKTLGRAEWVGAVIVHYSDE